MGIHRRFAGCVLAQLVHSTMLRYGIIRGKGRTIEHLPGSGCCLDQDTQILCRVLLQIIQQIFVNTAAYSANKLPMRVQGIHHGKDAQSDSWLLIRLGMLFLSKFPSSVMS